MTSFLTSTPTVALAATAGMAALGLTVVPSGTAWAAGTSYWVDNTSASCTDGGQATQAAPACTISAAVKKATQPGDTVHVVAGSYAEQVNVAGSGTASDPVTLVADTSSVTLLGASDLSSATWSATATSAWRTPLPTSAAPGQVLLDGTALPRATSATTTTNGSWFYDSAGGQLYVDVGGTDPATGHTVQVVRNYGVNVNARSYVVVRGLTARGQALAGFHSVNATHVSFTGDTATDSRGYGLHLESTSAGTVQDARASGNASVGIRFSGDTGATLSDSVSDHNALHGVSIVGSTGTVVDGVSSHDNGDSDPATRLATGIDISFLAATATAPAVVSSGTVVEDSTTYRNEDSGMQAYPGSTDTVFRRNLSYDNGDHGIDNLDAQGSTVVSNTVVGNAAAGINFEGNATGGSTGGTARDNIAVDNAVSAARTVGQIRVDAPSVTGTTIDRDLLRGPVLVAWNGTNHTTLASLRTAAGQESHGIAGDPGFVDLGGRDLHLAASSPAIDAAFSDVAHWQRLDHDGNPPSDDPAVSDTGTGPDAMADLGALERVVTPPPPPPGQPVAVGTLTPSQGTAPLAVHVDGSGSSSPGHTITSYNWACGNGTTIATATGTCTYTSEGSYTATLTVVDSTGATDVWTGAVNVAPPVVSPPPTGGPPPSGNPPPADTPVTVTARLAATPRTGTAPLSVALDASGSSTSDGSAVTSYAFGCGTGSAMAVQGSATTSCTYPTPGTYTATVTAQDAAGHRDEASTTITVTAAGSPVRARLTATPARGWAPMRVTLDATRSTASEGTAIASYRFWCGNGISRQGRSAVMLCRYPKPGRYLARVTVSDASGHRATAVVTVLARRDVPPTAVLVVSTHRPRPGERVVLDGTLSRDPDHTPVDTFRFACGNGVRTGTQRASRTTCRYAAGRHTVQMWVTDTAGHTSHVTTIVSVRPGRRSS